MPARFTLFGHASSGPSYKVGLFFALAGEPFSYVHVNLREGEHKQPAYLALQRYGQVPLVVDEWNGRKLCQSAAILEYLADVTGQFGGANLDERLRAREWLYWDFDRLAPPIYRSRTVKLGLRQAGPEVIEMYGADGRAALKVLDGHLAGRSWIVGEGPTIADIDAYGILVYADVAGFDLAAFGSVQVWMKRFEELPGFTDPRSLLPQASRTAV